MTFCNLQTTDFQIAWDICIFWHSRLLWANFSSSEHSSPHLRTITTDSAALSNYVLFRTVSPHSRRITTDPCILSLTDGFLVLLTFHTGEIRRCLIYLTLCVLKVTDSRSLFAIFKGFETTCLAYLHSRKFTSQTKLETCQAALPGLNPGVTLIHSPENGFCKPSLKKCQASPPGFEPISAGKPGKYHACAAVDESYTMAKWLAHLPGKERSLVRIPMVRLDIFQLGLQSAFSRV